MLIEPWSDDVWIGRPADRPNLTDDLDALLDQFVRRRPVPHLVLDLDGVGSASTRHLDVVVRLRDHAADAGRLLIVTRPRDTVWGTLLTAELDRAFEYAEDVAAALADLVAD